MSLVLDSEEYDKREIIDGTIYLMAPPNYRHNRIGTNLCRLIGTYLHGKRCKLSYESMVYLDDNNKFIPDLVVVCDRNKIRYDGIHGAPDLIVEILSPSTMQRDMGIKKNAYEKFGVKEYWIVSPKEKSIKTYIHDGEKLELDQIYLDLDDAELSMLSEQERAEQKIMLKLSLYDDFSVNIREVFEE